MLSSKQLFVSSSFIIYFNYCILGLIFTFLGLFAQHVFITNNDETKSAIDLTRKAFLAYQLGDCIDEQALCDAYSDMNFDNTMRRFKKNRASFSNTLMPTNDDIQFLNDIDLGILVLTDIKPLVTTDFDDAKVPDFSSS